ncbi:RagB/SusD family nutrient uptake outer membrane protein [Chryseolinea lacunae]|uniref:RagB/SusD family nutrient uptake outer membrane protein n=1 Tax=Chryseolinea lacunae TaxID=2801331 RepID=A0ABS1L2X2_9BACT|nr:RagB/SusD family nutrient uptake outer membrane protein [Chryseolinea lacunae]MBL0745798.1 RagB/SusD family nutrient uptake outer membrane protein [Chryseolinea lacunae]
MKTNFILKISTCLVLLAITTSCNDFLEEKSKSQLSPNSFFKSDGEAQLAVNGVYQIYHNKSLYNDVGLDKFYLHGADEVAANRAEDSDVHSYTFTEASQFILDTYMDLYSVVRNCDLFIESIEKSPNVSGDYRKQAVGELLFLRALAYFHLTNIWGDVPYFRTLLSIDELATIQRTDKNIIRQEMQADLQKAFELLPGSYTGVDLGRATKWAAATLKAKYHMMAGEWQGMLDESVKVINSGQFTLLDDYAEVFNQKDPLKQYNKEIIFVIDFTGKNRVINTLASFRVNNYNPRIARDEPFDMTQLQAFQKALADRNENMTGYGKAIPLPELADKSTWEEGDLRYDKSIVTSYLGFKLRWPYFSKMWNLDQANSSRDNSTNNNIVFRLADLYLMAAEAENELNGPSNAYPFVNKVRERAFEIDKPWSGLTQQEFRLKIRDERKYELSGEGGRKMDLVRWGVLVETVKKTLHRPFNNPQDNIRDRHVLYPLPQQEILLNPRLLDTDPTNNGYR